MPSALSNGIRIEYETFGAPSADPLVLIMGLGAQMLLWDEELCEQLAARGHFVIRFDNRDVGLSTKFDHAGTPDLMALVAALQSRRPVAAPYTLDDMADDAAGLLDALGLAAAHLVGASMGGMIAQTVAFRHPGRVRTLTSIMSTTGDPSLPPARPEAMGMLMVTPPAERAAAIEHAVRVWRTIGSPGFPFDEPRIRDRAGRQFDRCFHPAGTARQLAAVLAHGSRRARLRDVRAPTLVIHGSEDPLVPVEGGKDTAAAIPGAELLIIEGMGHDLPRGAWGRIVDAIVSHAATAAAPL
jgi:pimeloyl-ACP methyl ester carboxylesterase